MNFIRSLFAFFALAIILSSCSTFSKAGKVLRNEKVTESTDEFLIKKKEPLSQPPDFDKIPVPGTTDENIITGQEKIQKILKTSESTSNKTQTKSSSLESSILNKIKK
tara:strand:+ start:5064 stop:5387 length:324 start_codon:yes stop_codon:yes gene_type:complete